jgi:hypothetical protein
MTTATITDLQTALKETIDAAHKATPFALPIAVRIADSTTDAPPKQNDGCDIVVGFEASALLGRTTNKRLEQYLIPIKLRYRNGEGKQERLAECHLVAEQLRDLLAAYHSTTARVEQLITPHPFDLPASLTVGMFDHRFVLDCDVLRTLVTPDDSEPADPLPIFTKTRNAVWNAIDNWPAFTIDEASVWTRKFRDPADIEELALHDPCAADLPAIAVTWGPTSPEWWVNVMQNWPQQMFVTFWLPGHQLDVAELRAVQLMQALYQCAPEGSTVSYIRAAVGRPPSKTSPITLEPIELGRSQQLKAWRGQIALTLTGQMDPNA